MNKIWAKLNDWWTLPKFLGLSCLLLGLFGLIKGSIPYLPIPGLENFHQRIAPTLFGIGFTVLLIGAANEHLARNEERKRLILQMGSLDNALAIDATRMLRIRGWLTDGAVRSANLNRANLRGALLYNADLCSAHLNRAILKDTDLIGAKLAYTDLSEVDLTKADLTGADLTGTDLTDAILHETTMPNGTKHE